MTPLDDHEERLRHHEARITFLEDLMARVVALQEIVVDLLQRQRRDDDEANGR
jgi:hypothetical protein